MFRQVPKPKRKKQKKKKCKICSTRFVQFSPTQDCCTWKCALEKVIRDKKKKAKQEYLKGKEALKTLSEYLKDTEKECNAYIRDRDKNLPCISCGRFHNGQWHAGHYRSVGAAPHLRFNEDNINKQCSVCNKHKSGNSIEYRINLVKKIGIERVEALESSNSPALYTIEDAKRIRKEFKEKRKALSEKRN